jgi:hypothetical protein
LTPRGFRDSNEITIKLLSSLAFKFNLRCYIEESFYNSFMRIHVEAGRCMLSPVESRLESACFQRLKLISDELLSSFAFMFNFRRCIKEGGKATGTYGKGKLKCKLRGTVGMADDPGGKRPALFGTFDEGDGFTGVNGVGFTAGLCTCRSSSKPSMLL